MAKKLFELSLELEHYEKELKMMKPEDRVKGDVAFEISWHYYPLKIGKKAAKKHFKARVKTKGDWSRHVAAFNRYANHVLYERRHGNKDLKWQYGSTFFNNWEDWADMAKED